MAAPAIQLLNFLRRLDLSFSSYRYVCFLIERSRIFGKQNIQKMARNNKKRLGVGALVKAIYKFTHPRGIISTTFCNCAPKAKLSGLTVVRKEEKTVNSRSQMCVIFTHPIATNGIGELVELYTVEKHAIIDQEGPADEFFDVPAINQGAATIEVVQNPVVQGEIDRALNRLLHGQNDDEDLMLLRNNIQTDDDNEPAPENVPDAFITNAAANISPTIYDNEGGWVGDAFGVCNRRGGNRVVLDSLPTINTTDGDHTLLMLFEILFPKKFIIDVVLPTINANMRGERELSIQNFYVI